MRLIVASPLCEELRFVSDMFEEKVSLNDIKLKDITSNDVVLFSGGADISPAIYFEKPLERMPSGPPHSSTRDKVETFLYIAAKKAGAAMLGICRGSQLLFALAGGKLIQHVDNHNYCTHHIRVTENTKDLYIPATSTHHQMWYLNSLPVTFNLIAWTGNSRGENTSIPDNRSYRYILNDKIMLLTMEHEPEIIYIPDTRALLIQGHPEEVAQGHPYRTYCRDLVRKYLIGEVEANV